MFLSVLLSLDSANSNKSCALDVSFELNRRPCSATQTHHSSHEEIAETTSSSLAGYIASCESEYFTALLLRVNQTAFCIHARRLTARGCSCRTSVFVRDQTATKLWSFLVKRVRSSVVAHLTPRSNTPQHLTVCFFTLAWPV